MDGSPSALREAPPALSYLTRLDYMGLSVVDSHSNSNKTESSNFTLDEEKWESGSDCL